MNIKKKILSYIVGITMIFSSFSTAIAANISDTPFSFDNNTSDGYTQWRYKSNASKVYVYPQSGTTTFFSVQAATSATATSAGYSWPSYAIPVGQRSSITTYAYEWGYSYVRIHMHYNQHYVPVITTGVWSPDSNQNYYVYP